MPTPRSSIYFAPTSPLSAGTGLLPPNDCPQLRHFPLDPLSFGPASILYGTLWLRGATAAWRPSTISRRLYIRHIFKIEDQQRFTVDPVSWRAPQLAYGFQR